MKTNYSWILVESGIFTPYHQDQFFDQGGLERARRAVLLWYAGLGCFAERRFRGECDLGIISNLNIIYDLTFFCSVEICTSIFEKMFSGEPKWKERYHLLD